MSEKGYWWCNLCQAERAPESVTNEENCAVCGYRVEWIEPNVSTNSLLESIRDELAGMRKLLALYMAWSGAFTFHNAKEREKFGEQIAAVARGEDA